MQPRSEPLLWLQCLALGAIPLELLLIRLVLAGADPGPVPGVERFLIWGVGVLAPAVALWRRPADWGSLLLVRQPLASRSSDQLRISESHGALSSRVAVVMAAVILLPVLWWLDDSAVLASEFSPVSGQSRLATLLLVSPLLALMVWQVQQMVQAAALLLGSTAPVASTDASFRADAVATQRTSLGLQLLNLPSLEWPEPAVKPSNQGADGAMSVEDSEPETDDSWETVSLKVWLLTMLFLCAFELGSWVSISRLSTLVPRLLTRARRSRSSCRIAVSRSSQQVLAASRKVGTGWITLSQ